MTQAEALSILKTGANVFLTGSPGSGKTHTVNEYVAWLRSHGIEPAITASTGIAATHIHGMTIHSWSGIGIAHELSDMLVDSVASKEHVVKRIQKTNVLIIDEISMLSGDVLDIVDAVAKEVRHRTEPFGGMQVVLVGDFFQLPPIAKRGHESVFAFESKAWRTLNPLICYITEQHRQEDNVLLEVLDAIRGGTWDESHISHIMRRETEAEGLDADIPRLYTHNEDVDRINAQQLAALKGAQKEFRMTQGGANALIEGLKRGCLSPETLVLKENALVMCTKNNSAAGFVNGTLGRIEGFESGTGYPIVETFDGRSLIIAPMEWAVGEDGKVKAKIEQIPLRLAWAITIHKSQGQSLDAAAMNLSRIFEYGQGYVALSRVRTFEGIHLLGWSDAALSVHPKVVMLDNRLRSDSQQAAAAFDALDETGERETMEQNFIRASGGSVEVLGEHEAKRKAAKKTTYDETLAYAKEGKSAEQIATLRSLTLGTIADHLEKLASSGRLTKNEVTTMLPEGLSDGLPDIYEAFRKKGSEKLAPAYSLLGGAYTYDELKLAKIIFD